MKLHKLINLLRMRGAREVQRSSVGSVRVVKMASVAAAFPDKARVLKLAEQIHTRLTHAQQLKMSGTQTVNPQVNNFLSYHNMLCT